MRRYLGRDALIGHRGQKPERQRCDELAVNGVIESGWLIKNTYIYKNYSVS